MSGWTWSQIDHLGRRLVPTVLTLLLLVLGLVPLRIPYLVPVGPSFLLISAYYWGLHRPELLPGPVVFALGLLGDLMGGAPLGAGTLVLLLAYQATRSYRRILFNAGFVMIWLGFGAVVAGAGLALWALAALLAGAVPDGRPALFAGLLAFALYPLVAALFAQAERLVEHPAARRR
jgi:rod shape-determining protein MreD